MIIALKTILLFLSIFIILPIIFILLVLSIGKYFSITIDNDCWLANTKIKIVRNFLHRFVS
jgi:hypothetical protein